jgi:Transposase, Mutator family
MFLLNTPTQAPLGPPTTTDLQFPTPEGSVPLGSRRSPPLHLPLRGWVDTQGKQFTERSLHRLPQGLTVFAFPVAHQKRLRTTNALERVNQELKRRTRVARVFPNESSLLRLVSALLTELSEDWETGKIYLSIAPSNPLTN